MYQNCHTSLVANITTVHQKLMDVSRNVITG